MHILFLLVMVVWGLPLATVCAALIAASVSLPARRWLRAFLFSRPVPFGQDVI